MFVCLSSKEINTMAYNEKITDRVKEIIYITHKRIAENT